jgi:hypothetical protein
MKTLNILFDRLDTFDRVVFVVAIILIGIVCGI